MNSFSLFRSEVLEVAAEYGFEDLWFTGAAELRDREKEYGRWLSDGYHGSMGYLKRHQKLKYNPGAILPGCRSIFFVTVNYFQPSPTMRETIEVSGNIARYAWGRDYHNVMGKRLKRLARKLSAIFGEGKFRAFCDATPLAERTYAELAGVGFVGRNTLLITRRFGSWFFLGGIMSALDLEPSRSEPGVGESGKCPSGCRRCIDACPTGALFAPFRIDATRCISYLTIEHKGEIPIELRKKMGGWLFGCDICQDVCPFNQKTENTAEEGFRQHIAGPKISLESILEIDSREGYRERFAGSPLMRPGRGGLLRNACICAANFNDSNSVDYTEENSL